MGVAPSIAQAHVAIQPTPAKGVRIPDYLKRGDVIGITSPAGYISREAIGPAVCQMQAWGFHVRIGETIGKRDFTFGGTDAERRADLQQLMDDPEVKAIMCARGGYGSIRILDELHWNRFRKNPKWLIGFSDITILHMHLNTQLRVASMHSKMCNSFPDHWEEADALQQATILSIRDALSGKPTDYEASPNGYNRFGKARGELIGGNLRCIENLGGTTSSIHTKGKILFLEDTGEHLYSIDRMLYQLKRSGQLDQLNGLVIGGFKLPKEGGEDFGRSLEQIVLDKLNGFDFPVCFDFPVGHQRANYALKCGLTHELEVRDWGSTLKEVR